MDDYEMLPVLQEGMLFLTAQPRDTVEDAVDELRDALQRARDGLEAQTAEEEEMDSRAVGSRVVGTPSHSMTMVEGKAVGSLVAVIQAVQVG